MTESMKQKRISSKADAGKCQERKARNKRAQKAGKSNETYTPCDMESFLLGTPLG